MKESTPGFDYRVKYTTDGERLPEGVMYMSPRKNATGFDMLPRYYIPRCAMPPIQQFWVSVHFSMHD
eukprot:scaffold30009_cov51-Attheya_sp.AAC.2